MHPALGNLLYFKIQQNMMVNRSFYLYTQNMDYPEMKIMIFKRFKYCSVLKPDKSQI